VRRRYVRWRSCAACFWIVFRCRASLAVRDEEEVGA